MPTVVAQASGDGRKASVMQQTDHHIAAGRHDFGAVVTMDGASVLTHRHVFDIMERIFNRPMASFERKQAGRHSSNPT
jgi:hypothetical protein